MTNLVPYIDVYAPGTVKLQGLQMNCALGPSGISATKKEGDGITPAGNFALRRVFYRADRIDPPQTADGWCDDPSTAEYNQFVILPYAGSHEEFWREDHLYDIIIEVGYNDNPPVAGLGSAIFMHITRKNYLPTQGCVALAMDDMLSLLRACNPTTRLRINLATA